MADVYQDIVFPLRRIVFCFVLVLFLFSQDLCLCSAPVVNEPRNRSMIQCGSGIMQLKGQIRFGIGILGDTFVDIKLGFVLGVYLIYKAVNAVAFGFDDVGVTSLVNLPTVVK